MSGPAQIGPTNTLVDVTGLTVGHATLTGGGRLTGTTVVLAPDEGVVAGVDVRGGGPGTRETDLLDPRNVVERVHAICLSGGSAFGLAAADGVMAALFDDGVGLAMGGPGEVVPIVPGAVVFDLGRGGDFALRPDAGTGRAASVDVSEMPYTKSFQAMKNAMIAVVKTPGAASGTITLRNACQFVAPSTWAACSSSHGICWKYAASV